MPDGLSHAGDLVSELEVSDKRERRIQWERRFQSIMVTVAAAGIVWGVQTLVSVDKSVATLTVKQEQSDILISGMYRSDDARRDVAELSARIVSIGAATDRHTLSIYDMQGRVRVIEDRLHIRRHTPAPAAEAEQPR